MNLKDILVISGLPGMYKFVSQGRNGMIVESLADKKRFNVSITSKVSGLDDIAIFTDDDDMPLAEVLKNIFRKENGAQSISHKSPDLVIKDYFGQVLPTYDRGRVYVSDMRKVIHWYNLLQSMNLIDLEEPEQKAEEAQEPASDAQVS